MLTFACVQSERTAGHAAEARMLRDALLDVQEGVRKQRDEHTALVKSLHEPLPPGEKSTD